MRALTYSPDGKKIAATAAKSEALRIWNVESKKVEMELPLPSSKVYSCVFLDAGKMLVTSHYSMERTPDGREVTGEVRLWDLKTGKTQTTFAEGRGIAKLAVSPDGRLLATNEIWNAKQSRKLKYATRVWDLSEERVIATIDRGRGNVKFSMDGKTLITSGKVVEQWDPLTGKPLGALPNPGLPWPVSSLTVSPEGNLVAGGNAKGKVFVWDIPTRSLRATFTHGDGERLPPGLGFSPDGQTLAVATWIGLSSSLDREPTIDFWGIKTAERKATFVSPQEVIWSLMFHPDGQHLATGGIDAVELWSTKSFAPQR